jgi:hypothetical protein
MSVQDSASVARGLGWLLSCLGLLGLWSGTASGQLFFGNQRSVGGILVNAQGVVTQSTRDDRLQDRKALQAAVGKVPADLQPAVELRKVSLRGLEATLRGALAANAKRLPEEVLYLAGIQRLQYVLVYPEQNDIVLAGPGEGWRVDDNGSMVGMTTGLPVLRLDDLLVALRTVQAARAGGISVSIDPTEEGRQSFDQYMANVRRRRITFNEEVLAGAAAALGPQQISILGAPADSHFARVLVAADVRMKQLGMNLDKAPIAGLPGFLDLLKAKNRLPSNAMPRWWLACNYEPLARSEDRLVWQIRGQGVKAMTEDEIVDKSGKVHGTGQEDPIAKEFATRMTEKYEALAKKDLIFTELRNLMDLCVVAALLAKEDLPGLASCQLPVLTSASQINVGGLESPKQLATKCSFVKIGRNWVITASGGVSIESWAVAQRNEVKPELNGKHGPATPPGKSVWWN